MTRRAPSAASTAGGERAIIDTGPLVAFLDGDESHHAWARGAFARLAAPIATCEAVLTEALHLLRRTPDAQDKLLEWIDRGTLTVAFELGRECPAVRRLLRKYRDQPMSFADACLVRMAETMPCHVVCTLDRDFRVYRKDGGEEIRLISPNRST